MANRQEYNNRNQAEIYSGDCFVPKSLAQNNRLHKFACYRRWLNQLERIS